MMMTTQTLTAAEQELHCVHAGAAEYWATLPKADRERNFDRVLAFETFRGAELLAMAMNAAWVRSPQEKARRQAEETAHNNELLTCSRTGAQVARKDAVIAGDTVVAMAALSAVERSFLRL